MGRYIEAQINGNWEIVWKYIFGTQSSEMYRIYEDLGLGEYHPVCITYRAGEKGEQRAYKYLETRQGTDTDILILKQSDVTDLDGWIEIFSEDNLQKQKDTHFIAMLEAIRDFMITHADHEEITFEGEL